MKVLLLGGAGLEANTMAHDLLSHDADELILADYNEEEAKKRAKELAREYSKTVTAIKVDANNTEDLVEKMKDTNPDIVLNTIGPYYEFGIPVVKATIEAGYNYVDINDDAKPSKEILDTLHDDAKNAGVSVFIGCGATPGASNMLGKLGYLQLDNTDEIAIKWLWPGLTGGGESALMHGFEMLSDDCIQYLENDYQDVPAGSEKESISSSEGTYSGEVFYVGHGEPATMPRYITDVPTIINKGGMLPAELNDMFFNFMAAGLDDTEPMEIQGTEIRLPFVAMGILLRRFEDFEMENPDHGYVQILVSGQKDGENKELMYEFAGPGSELTSWPASVITQKIAQGDITAKGTYTPEYLDQATIEDIFKELEERGMKVKTSELSDS